MLQNCNAGSFQVGSMENLLFMNYVKLPIKFMPGLGDVTNLQMEEYAAKVDQSKLKVQ